MINHHAAQPQSILALANSLWRNRQLIKQMTKREVVDCSKGSVIMFLYPVFSPVTALPLEFRPWLMANPLTFIIKQAQEVLILGRLPNWIGLKTCTLTANVIAWEGYVWLQKNNKGFANVL